MPKRSMLACYRNRLDFYLTRGAEMYVPRPKKYMSLKEAGELAIQILLEAEARRLRFAEAEAAIGLSYEDT